MKYKVGQKVNISLAALYYGEHELKYVRIISLYDGVNFRWLENDDGDTCCYEGEECTIVSSTELPEQYRIVYGLINENGECPVFFQMTEHDLDICCFSKGDEGRNHYIIIMEHDTGKSGMYKTIMAVTHSQREAKAQFRESINKAETIAELTGEPYYKENGDGFAVWIKQDTSGGSVQLEMVKFFEDERKPSNQVFCTRDFVEDGTEYWSKGNWYEVVKWEPNGDCVIRHNHGIGTIYAEDFDEYFRR